MHVSRMHFNTFNLLESINEDIYNSEMTMASKILFGRARGRNLEDHLRNWMGVVIIVGVKLQWFFFSFLSAWAHNKKNMVTSFGVTNIFYNGLYF